MTDCNGCGHPPGEEDGEQVDRVTQGCRFTRSQWNSELHREDVVDAAVSNGLKPVVDEEEGGIVAYAVSEQYREMLLDVLNSGVDVRGGLEFPHRSGCAGEPVETGRVKDYGDGYNEEYRCPRCGVVADLQYCMAGYEQVETE